jgi:hypothetical protein
MELGLFKNSTTCVVVEESWMAWAVSIEDAIKEHWTLTDYEFIDLDEFEERKKNTKYSFILLNRGEYDDDPKGISYNFASLLLGDPADDINKMPELASIPVSYAGDQAAAYNYAIPAIVQFLQIQVRVLDKRRFCIKLFGLKYYNFGKKFQDKQLLLVKEDMAPEIDTKAKIKSIYDYHFELLSKDELAEKLKDNPENTLFLFHVGPEEDAPAGKCFEMIFSTDGKLYYYQRRDVTNEEPDGFREKDLKKVG